MRPLAAALALTVLATPAPAEPTAAERGYKALTETAFIPALLATAGLPNAWKQWGVNEKPADYDAAFRERYGLHPAPYPNDGLPMGLRKAPFLFVQGHRHATACSATAARSSARATSASGNSTLDIQALFEELGAADGAAGEAAVHLQQRPRHQRGRRLRRLPARLPRPGPEACSRVEEPRPARRPVRGRAGLVAAQEEEDDVPHRRRPTRARSAR